MSRAVRRQCLIRSVLKPQHACDHTLCRCSAKRLVLVGREEWDRGAVRVKLLDERTESDVPVSDV
jgi:hypothetical protein